MRHLSYSGGRLVLVFDDLRPLRAAAASVPSARFEGAAEGCAVFSFDPRADVATELSTAFAPLQVGEGAEHIRGLVRQREAVLAAAAMKPATHKRGNAAPPLPEDFLPNLLTQPMAHQLEAMRFCWARFRAGATGAALLMEQGTGKSLVAIGLANALRNQNAIRWALVLAPNSLRGTWAHPEDGEIARHSNLPAVVLTPDGSRVERLNLIERALGERHGDALLWIVLNYDTLNLAARKANQPGADLLRRLVSIAADGPPGLLICDESTALKSPTSNRTRAVQALALRFEKRLILTGTPVTRSPLDVFSQFEVLDQACLGHGTYLAFERAYAIHARRRMGGRQFLEVVGFHHLDDLERRVGEVSYRVRAEECLDLPEVVTRIVPVPISAAQSKVVRQLRDEMLAELDEGAAIDGRNVLTRYLRMQQILGGFTAGVGADGITPVEVQFDPNPKLEALFEYLETLFEDDRKAVVFCQFRAEIEAICAEATRRGWDPIAFYGGTSIEDREDGRRRFRTEAGCRLFVAQYQTGSKGLTLVEASDVIFYSLTFSLEDFLQARKRVHRIGQTRTVTETLLVATHPKGGRTLDHVIAEALRSKRDLADAVTGDARRIMEEL